MNQKMQEVRDFTTAKEIEDDLNSRWKENSENLPVLECKENSLSTENEKLRVNTPLAEKQDNFFKWCHEAILLLIEEYRSRADDFTSGRVSQKKTWEAISLILKQKGHDVTGPQCMSKFNGLKKTFKSVKDHNNKSGNGTKSWPYFDLLDGLIGAKPFMNPVATVSSTGKRNQSAKCSESPIECSDVPDDPPKKISKFLNKDILIEMQKSKNVAEENRERRHKEKMEQKQKCLELLEKIIETVRKN